MNELVTPNREGMLKRGSREQEPGRMLAIQSQVSLNFNPTTATESAHHLLLHNFANSNPGSWPRTPWFSLYVWNMTSNAPFRGIQYLPLTRFAQSCIQKDRPKLAAFSSLDRTVLKTAWPPSATMKRQCGQGKARQGKASCLDRSKTTQGFCYWA